MKFRKLTGLALAVIVAAMPIAACENTYTYVPTTSATVATGGDLAAEYPIPADAPRGTLQVESFGFADVSSPSAPDQQLSALHLRLTLVNHGTKAWTLDTRAQRLDLDHRGAGAPAFASADKGTPPVVIVPPSGKRVVDLFFMLPADMQSAGRLPAFDAMWQVNDGDQLVQGRTPFERLVVEPTPAYTYDYGSYDYWGPPYWYNPHYASYGFRGELVVPRAYHRHPVIIHRGIHNGEHRGAFHDPLRATPHGGGHHR